MTKIFGRFFKWGWIIVVRMLTAFSLWGAIDQVIAFNNAEILSGGWIHFLWSILWHAVGFGFVRYLIKIEDEFSQSGAVKMKIYVEEA